MHVVFGVIARDGMPFIEDCLASLAAVRKSVASSEVVLVDCLSKDGTTDAMLSYAASEAGVRVFRIEGTANAAVARNVAMNRAGKGALFLIDGDIVLNPEFVDDAIRAIEDGRADAVVGNLQEIQHDERFQPIRHIAKRRRIVGESLVRTSGGIIFLSPRIASGELRFDERLRRNEDRDFALRLSADGRLLRVAQSMGTHLTQAYLHPARIDRFYSEAYPRPLGQLLRKHWRFPDRLLAILRLEAGMLVGATYQFLLLATASMGLPWLVLAVLAVMAFDTLRFFRQGRIREFLPLRFATPWFVLRGLLGPAEPAPVYTVSQLA